LIYLSEKCPKEFKMVNNNEVNMGVAEEEQNGPPRRVRSRVGVSLRGRGRAGLKRALLRLPLTIK
jgi:predicted nucleic acid-binding Zn ribbon protein